MNKSWCISIETNINYCRLGWIYKNANISYNHISKHLKYLDIIQMCHRMLKHNTAILQLS